MNNEPRNRSLRVRRRPAPSPNALGSVGSNERWSLDRGDGEHEAATGKPDGERHDQQPPRYAQATSHSLRADRYMSGTSKVFPLGEETLPRSLFGRPTRRGYRAAVAQIIRDVKARHALSNEALADEIGCHKDTVANAEDEVGNLDPVTLLNIAFRFGEEAIRPVRQLYLCAPVDPPTKNGLIRRAVGLLNQAEDME